MRQTDYLVLHTVLPLVVIAALLLSIPLGNVLAGSGLSFLSYLPAAFVLVVALVLHYRFGYCPKCRQNLGRHIGSYCKNCGHKLTGGDAE